MTTIHAHYFSFELPVWQILPNEGLLPYLTLELRDSTQVRWTGIDLSTFTVNWQHAFDTTNWWTSALGCYHETLLLHHYASTEQPAPQALTAIEATTGRLRWTLPQAAFVQANGSFLQTVARQAATAYGTYTWRALQSGTAVADSLPELSVQNPHSGWQQSTAYATENTYYAVLSEFISNKTQQNSVGTINYAEINSCIVFLYYFYSANSITLSRSLLVINTAQVVLWHEISSNFGDSTALGSFVYSPSQILYLRSQCELTVLNLSKQ